MSKVWVPQDFLLQGRERGSSLETRLGFCIETCIENALDLSTITAAKPGLDPKKLLSSPLWAPFSR